jgi:hypothetical protein
MSVWLSTVRHVPIPKLIQNFWVLWFWVQLWVLGFGSVLDLGVLGFGSVLGLGVLGFRSVLGLGVLSFVLGFGFYSN